MVKKLNILNIRIDGDTQARVALDAAKVDEYAQSMKEGEEFPPVVVFFDGSEYWLADGFHRYHAMRQLSKASIDADVHTGTVQNAQIYSFGANSKRGLSISPEDNRSIIVRMLVHPISCTWTLGEIARHVGVSKMTVSRVKATQGSDETTVKTFTRNGKTIKMDTANSKTKKKTDSPQEEAPKAPEQSDELAHTINDLNDENQRLRDAIAIGQWDATDIEKIDAQEVIAELREQIRVLEIDNAALRDSRDTFQERNAELIKQVKSLQAKIAKLEG
jgi:FtsZ-binding cell division protein ZapB